MSLLRKTSAITVSCLLVMGGLGASAQADTKPDQLGEANKAMTMVADFVHSIEVQQIEVAVDQMIQQAAQYVNQLEAEQAAAYAAAHPPVQRQVTSAPSSSVGGACGGATNGADRFIGRESGGNPNVYNTGGSGAWGCYQIMPGTWSSSCSDLGSYGSASATVQAQCASRLPLSAWGG